MQDIKNLSSSEELEFPKANRLIYDWISFSTRVHTPDQIMDLIGMRDCPWEILGASNGYKFRHYFGGVSISFCDGDMSHVGGFYLLDMSGQGCRTFETYGNGDYDKLFSLVQRESGKDRILQDVRLTRLDVAFDDMTGLLDINEICDKTRRVEFVSRIKHYEAIYGSKGNSVNFGNKGSNVFIRIYDKARERGYTDGRHWVRCEIQFRKENASGFVFKLPGKELSELYCGVLKNYLSFREVNVSDSNIRRWAESTWWTTFLDGARAISVAEKPGVIYNLTACEKYVLTQPVGSIKTLIKVYGADGVIQMFENAPMPKNPKYNRLIAQVEAERGRRTQINGERAAVLESDEELVTFLEFQDDLRAEYAQIARESAEKWCASQRASDRQSARDFLKNHGLDLSKN